ncbi:MAG: ZIP family metal transporter [Chloroflexi bacterium]|nr:ZIP family metal transporter [Chloroflexota bacterium]
MLIRTGGASAICRRNLIGDEAHIVQDGMLIAAAFMSGTPVGIATTVSILLHEVPHELVDFAVLVHSGFSDRKALLFNFLSALMAVVGALLVLFLGTRVEGATAWVLEHEPVTLLAVVAQPMVPALGGDPRDPPRHPTQIPSHPAVRLTTSAPSPNFPVRAESEPKERFDFLSLVRRHREHHEGHVDDASRP